MNNLSSHDNKQPPSDEPPSYEQLEGFQNGPAGQQNYTNAPQYYSSNYGPDEYPPEKKQGGEYDSEPPYSQVNYNTNNGSGNYGGFQQNQQQQHHQPPPGVYTLPPQKVNIAHETTDRYTRPGYADYVRRDNERVAQGDAPKPREAFKNGAPLAPSKKSLLLSGGFPGALGTTYYSSSQR